MSLGGSQLTSLLPNGQFNIAALNIELDLPVAPLHTPAGNALLRIWGLGLQDLQNAFNLNAVANSGNYYSIEIYAGMSAGLPLANPAQARLLVKASILQAFGNWVGTEQTVDIILAPYTGTPSVPANHTLNWLNNTPLSSALMSTLQTTYPNAKIQINISPRLTQNHDEPGVYGSLGQLSTYVNTLSKTIIKDAGYAGVTMVYDGTTITVSDQTSAQSSAIAILFTDLVGQPTWIEPQTIQTKCVLRGDLDISSVITLPQTLVTNTAASQSGLTGNPANKLTFSGNYLVTDIHHYGNFRQPDSASWATVINAIPQMSVS